jgi:CDP-2,3-bis-(O-geranylgeranyl)-sn-glycerol synthase
MYEVIATIGLAVWLGLPAWIANSTPVIFGGGKPIDGGKLFRDGRRILGDGKTIRGFLAGVIFGSLTGFIQALAAPSVRSMMVDYVDVTSDMDIILNMSSTFSGITVSVTVAALFSIGTLFGDMSGSFIKRRVSVKSGGPSPFLDQLGFIIMALIFAAPLLQPSPIYPMVLILITLGVHWISNALGYLLGFKKNPW